MATTIEAFELSIAIKGEAEANGYLEIQRQIAEQIRKTREQNKQLNKELRSLNKDSNLSLEERLQKEKELSSQLAKNTNELKQLSKEQRNANDAFKTVSTATSAYDKLNSELKILRKRVKDAQAAGSIVDQKDIARVKQLDAELKKIDASSGQFQRNVGNYKSAFNGLGTSIKGASVATALAVGIQEIGRFIGQSITLFADFTNQIAILQAVSGASADEIARLESEAKRLGETTFFTASQVAELQTNFARGGFNPDEIIAMTEATLALSVATGEELSDASQVVASNLRAFGLAAGESEGFVNTLTTTLNRSNQRLNDFAEASKELAPTAKLLNISYQESAAAIGLLADNGLRGTTATTTLSTSLIRLSDNSKKYAKAANELGVEVFNQQGEFVGLAQLLENVNTATEGYTEEQKAAAVSQIFGIQAARNFNILLNAQKEVVTENGKETLKGAEALRGFTQELENTGNSAQRAADIVGDTLTGDFKTFQSAFEGVQIRINERFENLTRGVVQFGTAIVRGIGEAFEFLSNAFSPVVSAFRELFSEISEGNIRSEVLYGALQLIGGVIVLTANSLAITIKNVATLVARFKELALSIPGVSTAFDFLRNLTIEIIDSISKVPAFLNGVGRAFQQFFSDISNLSFDSSRLSSAFDEGFNEALIRQKTKAAADAAKEETKKATDEIGNDFSTIPDKLTSATKKATEVVKGSINDLKAQIKTLQDQLGDSTSPELFAAIQKEIDATEEKMQRIIGQAAILARGTDNLGDVQTIDTLNTVSNVVSTTEETTSDEIVNAGGEALEKAAEDAAVAEQLEAESLQRRTQNYEAFANQVGDAFGGLLSGEEDAFRDFTRSILSSSVDLLEAQLETFIVRLRAQALINFATGNFAGGIGNIAAIGGIRALFSIARNLIGRLHDGGVVAANGSSDSGLAPNEVVKILEKKEVVLNKRSMADKTIRSWKGNNMQIASAINKSNGGVDFAPGAKAISDSASNFDYAALLGDPANYAPPARPLFIIQNGVATRTDGASVELSDNTLKKLSENLASEMANVNIETNLTESNRRFKKMQRRNKARYNS